MNRNERRKQGNPVKPKTYVLSENQIENIKNAAVREAFQMLLSIPLVVLYDKFGFRKVRLDRFLHYALGWVDSIQTGEITLDEMLKICRDEAGIKIEDYK